MAIDAVVAHTLFYVRDSSHANSLTPSIETYWEISPRTVHYSTTAEKTIVARIAAEIIFSNDTGIIKEDKFILETIPAKSVNELGLHRIIDLRRYFLPTGSIHMKFLLQDLADASNKYVYSDSFTVTAPPDNAVFYSGLQFLDTIMASPEKTAFEKNGRQQIPVCTNFLDEPKQTLRYYAEMYGIEHVPTTDFPLVQRVSITKKEDDLPIDNFLKIDTLKNKDGVPLSGSFDIRYLASGNYFLTVSLLNQYHQELASRSLFFQRLNMHPLVDTVKKAKIAAAVDTGMQTVNVLDLNKTFVAKYNLVEIHQILKMLLPFSDYAATQTINGFLKKQDDLYTRYYIYNYFAAINKKDPTAAWKEFSKKIIEINKMFNAHGIAGYETERGFIYLRYGPPTDIITVENEQGALPYEIWQYNTLTQQNHKEIADAVFLFYRRTELDDYQLLHSTVPGEVQNPNWRHYLYVGTNNGNSRAEQYLTK